MSSSSVRVVYCHCAYAQVVPKLVKEQVLQQLIESEIPFEAVSDLCEMSAKHDQLLKQLADAGTTGGVKIAACYPRAVKWLFAAADATLPDEGVAIFNMRTETAENVVAAVLGDGFKREGSNGEGSNGDVPKEST